MCMYCVDQLFGQPSMYVCMYVCMQIFHDKPLVWGHRFLFKPSIRVDLNSFFPAPL